MLSRKYMIAMVATPLMTAALAVTGAAQERHVPLPTHSETISGVPVQFTGRLVLNPHPMCERLGAGIIVELNDLAAKLIQIVRVAVPPRDDHCGDKQSISAAHLSRSGDNLHVKVDGNVGRQECVKTKVPEFRGLKVTMKTRVVASSTLDTNASITAVFDPIVEGQRRLRFSLVSGPNTRVSNDLARFLISAFNLEGRINDKVREAIERAINAENAMLELPSHLQQFGVRFTDARIVDGHGGLAIRIDGEIPVPLQLRPTTFGLMGFDTSNCG